MENTSIFNNNNEIEKIISFRIIKKVTLIIIEFIRVLMTTKWKFYTASLLFWELHFVSIVFARMELTEM